MKLRGRGQRILPNFPEYSDGFFKKIFKDSSELPFEILQDSSVWDSLELLSGILWRFF